MKSINTYEIFKFYVPEKLNCAAFFPDRNLISTMGFSDGRFRIHDIYSGKQVWEHEGLGSAGSMINYAQYAISGMGGGQIFIWDIDNRRFHGELGDHGPFVEVSSLEVTTRGSTLIAGDKNGSVRLWNLTDGYSIKLGNHVGTVYCVAISPDGNLGVSGGFEEGIVQIWDCNSYKKVEKFMDKTLALKFSQDGRYILQMAGNIKKRDIITNELIWSLSTIEESYYIGAFSIDDYYVLCGGRNVFSLLDAETGNKLVSFKGQTGMVIGLGFSSNGEQLFSASDDGTVRIWNLPL